jgi:hypothetical protein
MNAQDLRDLLRSRPFVPFRLYATDVLATFDIPTGRWCYGPG